MSVTKLFYRVEENINIRKRNLMREAYFSLIVDRRPRDAKDFSRLGYIVTGNVQNVSDVIAFEIFECRQFDTEVCIAVENEIEIEIFGHQLTHSSHPFSIVFC
jgi:hypothetical protein